METTPQERAIVERLASADCVPWRGDDAPTGTTVEAAVRCQPGEGAATQLTLAAFSDGEALRDAWAAHLAAIEPKLEDASAACEGSAAGLRRWGFGRLACHVQDGSATISWTDTRSSLLGIAQAADADLAALYDWWQGDGKSIGRAAAGSTTPTEPGTDRPLVRVPGAPNDVMCTSMDEPIVDVHGRTWEVERVRFVNRADYERVVVELQRTGRVRGGRRASVTVDRMPVDDVASAFPRAPEPRRGRIAVAVRMDRVVRAPDLRAYRPKGLDLVKELSIVRGARSRTAILALNGDGCYQVRVPVFGPAATGNEDRAEIFIDVLE